ncbi:uncharacterized protein A1O5_09398 [Cladophialophora psammophila CBS 110553]|uniref:Cyclase n=1 Tax=Cladophialophora psammophila CBS 110553 TaxID=1182543 RepID=W9WQZ4_9EURO|nr:uncharacterized protein A1O5_09398 [Cladophialophora psammophila CBS 110553]EXJ67385.1 hypothetical protein A1O5_09398 [Cladophialophora psammophila CBS 110553]
MDLPSFDPDAEKLPKLSELPSIDGAPSNAAWFWGKHDQLGRLNLLTPRRIANAAKQIQTGKTVCLNFPAELPAPPFFGRQGFKHEIKAITDYAYDDLHTLNTQSGSQWDGFRHVGINHNDSFIWYNNTTRAQILSTEKLGIHHWAKKGIAGRGVLIDFYSYSKRSYDPFTARKITVEEIEACARACHVEFNYGDILVVRTGWSEAYKKLDADGRMKIGSKSNSELEFAGLSRGNSMLEFLHDNYFSAVASDSPAFESWPFDEPEHLHYYLLPRWGVPIGEMWDLDGLAELCQKTGRYTFFLASSPANVQGEGLSPYYKTVM